MKKFIFIISLLMGSSTFAQVQLKLLTSWDSFIRDINSQGKGIGGGYNEGYYDFTTNSFSQPELEVRDILAINDNGQIAGMIEVANQGVIPGIRSAGMWIAPPAFFNSSGIYVIQDISENGKYLVGYTDYQHEEGACGFIYNTQTELLTFFPSTLYRRTNIHAVNNNGIAIGHVILSDVTSGNEISRPAYFEVETENIVLISTEEQHGKAHGINNNNEIVGEANGKPFIFNLATSEFTTYTVAENHLYSSFYSISDNGIAVGYAGWEGAPGLKDYPIIYHPDLGNQPVLLTDVLTGLGLDASALDNAQFANANTISSDGNYAAGWFTSEELNSDGTGWVVYFDNSLLNTHCPYTIWDGEVWTNGNPSIDKKAIIDGNLVLNENLEACELEVRENGRLEIPSGLSFTINGLITNKTSAENFIVSSGANLIQRQDVENIGEITVERESQEIVRLDYTLWSSPVINQQLQEFSPQTLPNRIYTYETTTATESTHGAYVVVPNAKDDFTNGKGYLFRAPNNWNSTNPEPFLGIFKGVPYNGNISIYTFGNSDLTAYTSIGNPYPSNMDADLFLQANPSVSTLYFWTNPTSVSTGNNYATYTILGGVASGNSTNIPNGNISVGQGFIVNNNSTTFSEVVFNNSMRVAESAIFFKGNGTDKHRIWLNLNNDQNERLSQALVGYMKRATNEVDAQIDGKMFGNEGSALYNIIGEDKFAIQGRALPFEKSDVVKLGFKAVEAGKFNISLSNFDGLFAEGEVKVYLKDKQLNITHNLMESDYNFESIAGEFNDRFEIVYEKEVMGTADLTANSIQVYTQKENIIVNSKSEKINSVELFDLTGRKIHSNNNVNANQYEMETNSKGVIVVKVQAENGKMIDKKVILK